jgi:hypothetical protein
VSVPLVPLIVRVYVPGGVETLVATVKVELPEPVTEVGLNAAVAPVGRPLALSATLPVKPPSDDALTVYVVLALGATDCEVGVAESVKPGVTVRLAVAVPFLVVSTVLAAVIVTDCAAVTGLGAVYSPLALMVPTLGLIVQVTPLLTAPVSCEVNCCVSPLVSEADGGVTVTLMGINVIAEVAHTSGFTVEHALAVTTVCELTEELAV